MGEIYSPIPQPQHNNNIESSGLNLDNKISPSIILIIIILAIIFFVSGLLHLLIRFLLRPNARDPDEFPDNVTALQGQLQQLFHLHDSGVDQSYIDTLPVFQYKAIIGVKDPFDCAVCLCEFEPDDKLRLLPQCSHAFHVDCIDTWLLSHSTCPLCRASLLCHEFGGYNGNGPGVGPLGVGLSPVVCVLESGSNTVESSMELERETGPGVGPEVEVCGPGFGLGSNRSDANVGVQVEGGKKEDKIVTVKLGKFRSVEGGEGSSEINYSNYSNNSNSSNNNNNHSNNNVGNNGAPNCGVSSNELGSRRCYSMGSFAYILDETTSLQVPIRTPMKKEKIAKKGNYHLKVGHRGAMSEYGGCGESMRELNGIEEFRGIEKGNNNHHNESSCKKESFSISKIWSRGGDKKGKGNGNGNGIIEVDQSSRRTISEFEIDVSELGNDEETQSCYSVDSFANPNGNTTTTSSSSTRRTLLWLMGRQNKIVHNHSSFSSNV